jgi:hypothetical protein
MNFFKDTTMTTDAAVSLSSRTCLYVPLICMIAGLFLVGCEKNDQNKTLSQPASAMYEKATTLEGVVSDNHGPVKSGEIRAADRNNQVVASTVIHDNGRYSVTIPANTGLPVVLTYSPDFQNTSAEKFIAAVVYTNITRYDINPRTTAIAKKAQAMGGYTHGNLILAAESAASVPDKNKTTAGFRGDPTTQYGGWH